MKKTKTIRLSDEIQKQRNQFLDEVLKLSLEVEHV